MCLQARHDEEAAALAKRRTNFQRDRDQLAKEAEAEYEEACERAAFKLQVCCRPRDCPRLPLPCIVSQLSDLYSVGCHSTRCFRMSSTRVSASQNITVCFTALTSTAPS